MFVDSIVGFTTIDTTTTSTSTSTRRIQRQLQPRRPNYNVVTRLARGGGCSALSSAAATLNAFWKSRPFVAAATVCAVKALAADAVAQKREQVSSWDIRRTVSLVIYGALYQGLCQEFIYNEFYTRLFGAASTLRIVTSKVLFDAAVHNALLCVPMAYVVKALVYRHSFGEAIRRYVDDVQHHGLLYKYYAIWMPTNFVMYTVVPKHWRITFMATISFFWMILLSTISSRRRK